MADINTPFNDLGTDTKDFEDPVQPAAPGQRDEGDPAGGDPPADPKQAPTQQNTAEELPAYLKNTPFKTNEDLANGYRNLQRLVSDKDQKFKDLNRTVQDLVRSLAGQSAGKPQQFVTKEDADAFLKRFLANPSETLQAAVDNALNQALKQHNEPLRNELGELKQDRMIERFLGGEGKDLSPELQERFLQILEQHADLLNFLVEKKGQNPLDHAMIMLKAEYPEHFAQAKQQQKDTATQSLRDAKQSASGLGGKGTSVRQSEQPRDAFDDVLDLHKSMTTPGR